MKLEQIFAKLNPRARTRNTWDAIIPGGLRCRQCGKNNGYQEVHRKLALDEVI